MHGLTPAAFPLGIVLFFSIFFFFLFFYLFTRHANAKIGEVF